MSGLKNTFRRLGNFALTGEYVTSADTRKKQAAAEREAKNRLFARPEVPDEEELARINRRRTAQRRGSRLETVLTDTLGPGGE